MRRTKEEAARTREAIVEAALGCFDRHGIAQTTLDQIAAAAKVTKGAVYHHFSGKHAILHEIREQLTLPLMDEADTSLLHHSGRPALERIEHFLLGMLDGLERDSRKRCALTVMNFKCEYVGELAGELSDALVNLDRLVGAFETAYKDARKCRETLPDLRPRIAAFETMAFMSGLMKLWLMDHATGGFRRDARAAIRAHVRSRKVSMLPAARK